MPEGGPELGNMLSGRERNDGQRVNIDFAKLIRAESVAERVFRDTDPSTSSKYQRYVNSMMGWSNLKLAHELMDSTPDYWQQDPEYAKALVDEIRARGLDKA